jgi:alkylation response protein AidB-like acyl-CoA dehydrogenase
MSLELTARTEQGAHLVALAETLAAEIGPCAAPHDRDGRFPFASFAAVKASGYFGAPIPSELGGLGVTSVHDVIVASSRLARGDAALTLGVNMHLAYVLNVVRRWQIARASGDGRRTEAFAGSLEQIAREGTVFAAAGSEPGQDLTRPATTATRTEDGWIVSGHKVFCTMSAAADILYTAVSFADREGRERYGYALVPREAPGVVVHDDWDALGMRASGSNSVSFEDVRLPFSALRGGLPGRRRGRVHGAESQCGAASRSRRARRRRGGRRPHQRPAPRARRPRPAHAAARGRECRRPLRLPRCPLTRRSSHRRAARARPDVDRHS